MEIRPHRSEKHKYVESDDVPMTKTEMLNVNGKPSALILHLCSLFVFLSSAELFPINYQLNNPSCLSLPYDCYLHIHYTCPIPNCVEMKQHCMAL